MAGGDHPVPRVSRGPHGRGRRPRIGGPGIEERQRLGTGRIRFAAPAIALLIGLAGAAPPDPATRVFQGTWTAVGKRTTVELGAGRGASVAEFSGLLVLTGPLRPGAGFRATAVVFNDSATGLVGRAVWSDSRGDQVFSELRSPAGSQTIVGSVVGGTGRYRDVTGAYSFAWRFLIEGEDGMVQGQSVGFSGQLRTAAPAVPPPGRPR